MHVTSKAPNVPRRHLASIFRSDGKTGFSLGPLSYFITVRQFGTIDLFPSPSQSAAAIQERKRYFVMHIFLQFITSLSAYWLDCVLA